MLGGAGRNSLEKITLKILEHQHEENF